MKKFSACLCSLMLMFTMLLPASAYTQKLSNDLRISDAEHNEPLDINLKDVTMAESRVNASRSVFPAAEAIETDSSDLVSQMTLQSSDINQSINLTKRSAIQEFQSTRSANQGFHFSGVIDKANGMFTIYPITLNNNQNIHAELIGPSSSALNYDLRLYEMDVNTGTIGALVDICSYTKSATLAIPQTVATINRNSTAKNYALIVYAREGYSSTDTFDINITLGVGGDPAESNDNAFKAYSFGTLGVQGISVQGTNLDSQKDVDWFAFSAPNLSDFDKIRILNNANSNVKYQLYYVSNGTTLVEVQPTNGLYPIRTGMNYLRVTDNGNNFSAGDVSYAPLITVSFKPSKMMSEVHMNEYVGIPTQTYKVWNANETSFWPEKRNALLSGCKLEWKATFLSSSGYLCPDAKNALHIRTTNTSWVPIQFQSANADGNPAENGVATCVLPKSVGCRGVYSGVSGMSYDVACTLSMWADGFPAIISGPVFVTSRIMT